MNEPIEDIEQLEESILKFTEESLEGDKYFNYDKFAA